MILSKSVVAENVPAKSNPVNAIIAVPVKQELFLGSRYFFMNTNNADQVGTYFFANGLNVNLSYAYYNLFDKLPNRYKDSVTKFQKLNFTVAYSQVANLNSSDLSLSNRYEIGLFDIQNPASRNFGNLNMCYLNYENRRNNIEIKVGRMVPMNPFINAQDGRLRPTSIQGAQVVLYRSTKNKLFYYNVDLSFATDILARSSNQWMSINESIGLYPQGVSVTGKPAQYQKIHANFGKILYFPSAKAIYQFPQKDKDAHTISGQYHILFMDKLMYTNMFNLDGVYTVTKKMKIGTSAMWIQQQFLVDSSGILQEKRYAETNEKSNVYSGKLWFDYKLVNSKHTLNIAMTNISGDGRYLMPREWGKDPFYTFMPRERNEGFGNVHAYTVNYIAKRNLKNMPKYLPLKSFSLDLGYGKYNLPDVKDFRLNKYGMPSYQQINAVLNLDFQIKSATKFLKQHEFNLRFWYIQKINSGDTYNLVKYVANKVDMTQVNIVLNYLIAIF